MIFGISLGLSYCNIDGSVTDSSGATPPGQVVTPTFNPDGTVNRTTTDGLGSDSLSGVYLQGNPS